MRFKVYNAWPTTVAYSDLNAGDNALYVEQMTLVHEGFDLNWGKFNDTTKAFENATAF
jgi:phage tail-like protein